MKDPAALQASLDQAQAHTKIWVTDTQVTSQWCRGTVRPFTGQLDRNVVQYNAPGGTSGLIIRPEKFPAGVTLLIAVQLSTGSQTGATGAPGTGVAMAGYGTTWAVGPTADCS
ncbi:hypothetical protein [uncultured Jatrophihabitans sp.]|uniref:hypothetical protein n=1 Tax=uncultured Jatrophihabitans sp. TaxID=1610747 RepID=UPI0035CBC09E